LFFVVDGPASPALLLHSTAEMELQQGEQGELSDCSCIMSTSYHFNPCRILLTKSIYLYLKFFVRKILLFLPQQKKYDQRMYFFSLISKLSSRIHLNIKNRDTYHFC
jgi:hypothetical protein